MTEFIQAIDGLLGMPAMLFTGIGLVLSVYSIIQLRRGRLLMAGTQGLLSVLMLSLGIILASFGLNLYTYQRLTFEQEIADIQFWQAGPQKYLTVLTTTDGSNEQNYMLYGDEWQLDARILKWTAPAIISGLDSRYRLERLSGRYRNLAQERLATRSVFDLSVETGLHIWPVLVRLSSYVNWIDAYYGNSAYLPMADQASYRIYLTQSGLIARPENEAAQQAVREWN